MSKTRWYSLSRKNVFGKIGSSEKGLSSSEAEKRLKSHGRNKIEEAKQKSPISIFVSQFENLLVLLLMFAVGISIVVGAIVDATVIFVILIANAVLGFIQEYRAEKAIESLKKLSSHKAVVLRDGKEKKIDSEELVPGDLIFLSEGDRVPASARIIESYSLRVDESTLTGESTPVDKTTQKIPKKAPTADQRNMVFMNTTITKGRCKALVVATGMETEIGHVAEMIQTVDRKKTPLQRKLAEVSKSIGLAVVGIAVLIFALGLFRGGEIFDMLITAIALAVAAVPEGLPAVVTITLALGLSRMAKSKSLVRKLPAVETLGATTVICSDKTGTLTKNEMTVKKIYANGKLINVTGSGYDPGGDFILKKKKLDILKHKTYELLLRIGTLCNTAKLSKGRKWSVLGDPTEGSLVVSARKAGLDEKKLAKNYKHIGEIPFDSKRKLMSVCYISPTNKRVAYVKGAPEILLSKCTHIFRNGKVSKMKPSDRKEILSNNKKMADSALRVLGMAYRVLPKSVKKFTPKNTEKQLVFVGLQGMMDPPRKEVRKAVRVCKRAGIKSIMITGDHKATASAIAKKVGIMRSEKEIITGSELDNLSKKEFSKRIEDIKVYARVSPEHKVRILKGWQDRKEVVSMTGDGVNDAPALKNADIGVAMGRAGTDVAKEASAMILQDDNFSTIVKAIRQGRSIYSNVKNFIRYLLSSNVGEVMVIFTAALLGLPLPLIAVQILWMNLLTDGVPALALGVDPPEKGVMSRSPRDPGKPTIGKQMWLFIFIVGFVIMAGTVGLFWHYLPQGLEYARTMGFTTLVMFQMWNVFNSRTKKTIFNKSFWNNKWLLTAVVSSIMLQLVVVYVPWFQNWFGTVALGALDWAWVVLVSFTIVPTIEVKKLIQSHIRNT